MEILLLLIVGAVGTTVFFYVQRDGGDDEPAPVTTPLGAGRVQDAVPSDPRQRPVAAEDLEYLEFFNLPRDLTAGEAERVIARDWKGRAAEEKREWHAFYAVLEDFSDPDLVAAFGLRDVRRPTLMRAIESLRNRGKSFRYIDEHADELAKAIVALDPATDVHRPERRSDPQ